MAKNNNLTDFLTDVANAIREKKGTTDPINPQNFSDEIASFSGSTTEIVNLTLTADSNASALIGATITVTAPNTVKTFTWEGSMITFEMVAGQEYTVVFSDVIGFHSVSSATFTSVAGNVRNVIGAYIEIQSSTIRINQNVTDPATMISGDVNGVHIRLIRQNSHRYLGKYTADNTMTICQLDDGDSNYYHDGSVADLKGFINVATLGEGDVYMKLPKFFYKAVEFSSNIWDISFYYGPNKPSSEWKEWSGNELIGVYESIWGYTTVNGGDTSLAGYYYVGCYSGRKTETTNTATANNWLSYARNRGNGFSVTKWKHHNIMAILFYAMYGTTNCQAVIGSGTSALDKTSGQTDSLGMSDTVAGVNGDNQSINFWGLENWWGNRYEYIDNIVVPRVKNTNGETWNITEDDDSIRSIEVKNGNAFISKLILGENIDVAPLELGGSSSTGYCDNYNANYNSNDTYDMIVVRSYSVNDKHCGVSGTAVFRRNYNYNYIIGRLCFSGNIIEERDVNMYKSIVPAII